MIDSEAAKTSDDLERPGFGFNNKKLTKSSNPRFGACSSNSNTDNGENFMNQIREATERARKIASGSTDVVKNIINQPIDITVSMSDEQKKQYAEQKEVKKSLSYI